MFTTSREARLPSAERTASGPIHSGSASAASLLASTTFAFSTPRAHTGFASLSLAVPGQKDPKSASCCAKTVKEAATGLEFSKEFCTRGSANCSKVTGLGVRAKKILGLKNINGTAIIARGNWNLAVSVWLCADKRRRDAVDLIDCSGTKHDC
eukprot:scaffold331996_cov38-Prasinocladus_malaysianus.AAC.1